MERPHHFSDAFQMKMSAMMPIDTGMMSSLTHSGTPMGSIFGSSRLACTTRALAYARMATTAAATEYESRRVTSRAVPSPKNSAVESGRCLAWLVAAIPPTKASQSVSCCT